MKTKTELLKAVENKNGWERGTCEIIDSRDYCRLAKYFPVSEWEKFGVALKSGAAQPETVVEWTKTNIIADMLQDLEFAIEKAENQRGISSSLMFEVMKMWMWILDDELADEYEYYDFGLPFYTAIEEKYDSEC